MSKLSQLPQVMWSLLIHQADLSLGKQEFMGLKILYPPSGIIEDKKFQNYLDLDCQFFTKITQFNEKQRV